MLDIIPTLLTLTFLVFCYDQMVISSLQRQGKYDPKTHRTMLSRVLFKPVSIAVKAFIPMKPKPDESNSSWVPDGDLSSFKYESTVCMNKRGKKTRLSHFFDDNQHGWFKIETINNQGLQTNPARFEPATVAFDVKKLQFV